MPDPQTIAKIQNALNTLTFALQVLTEEINKLIATIRALEAEIAEMKKKVEEGVPAGTEPKPQ